MCKESEPNLDDVAMLTLSCAILLMRVRAGNMVCDADLSKERMEFLILAPPVYLHSDDFSVKEVLNKGLKFSKL